MDNNNKHIDHNSTAQYIDWLRGQGERPDESVIEHVAACYECKEEILELSEILDMEDKTIDQRQLRKSNRQLIIRAAAVLIGVMLVALAIEFLRPDNDPIQIVSDDVDSVQLTPKDSLYDTQEAIFPEAKDDTPVITMVQHDTIKFAMNFEPNRGLEVLINAHFRSNTIVDESSKEQLQAVYYKGDKFRFDFSRYKKRNVVVSIVDHSGSSIVQLSTNDDSSTVSLDFDPGLYYWKLSTSDELLELGKFRLYSKDN